MKAKVLQQYDENLIPVSCSQNSFNNSIFKASVRVFLGASLLSSLIGNMSGSLPNNSYSDYHSQTVVVSPINDLTAKSFNVDLQSVINRTILAKIASLEKGWNSYNGLSFDSKDIEVFSHTLALLEKQPVINPTGRKSLFFEYLFDNTKIGYELFSDKLVEVIIQNGDYSHAVTNSYSEGFDSIINSRVKDYS